MTQKSVLHKYLDRRDISTLDLTFKTLYHTTSVLKCLPFLNCSVNSHSTPTQCLHTHTITFSGTRQKSKEMGCYYIQCIQLPDVELACHICLSCTTHIILCALLWVSAFNVYHLHLMCVSAGSVSDAVKLSVHNMHTIATYMLIPYFPDYKSPIGYSILI